LAVLRKLGRGSTLDRSTRAVLSEKCGDAIPKRS
jgi:hypothetical protein